MYGTLLLTLAAATPCVRVPLLVAVEQLNAVMVPAGKATVLVKVQVCPPMFKAKLAIPLEVGVPKIMYVRFPAPEVNDPACSAAYKPVTPVELTTCPL